jgi:hypothetical protein
VSNPGFRPAHLTGCTGRDRPTMAVSTRNPLFWVDKQIVRPTSRRANASSRRTTHESKCNNRHRRCSSGHRSRHDVQVGF